MSHTLWLSLHLFLLPVSPSCYHN
ncbi:hypothetical protein F383_24904 [Gossypium arboreum]|uniref:Uncharacterized protein n=1 Tax=Gossypium arboreum TaxID=29729 RepID=A0A0B0P6R8_GOSAR|nr:hypothetical protein F383_24904 [Gossypium arboreum]